MNFRNKNTSKKAPKLLTNVQNLRLLSKAEKAGLLSLGATPPFPPSPSFTPSLLAIIIIS